MRATAIVAFATALVASMAIWTGPAAALDVITPVKPVKQGGPPVPAPPSTTNATDKPPPPRTKLDPCADVHTFRTTQARAMCVAERGFPDVPDGE
jgi:hypothetical protein